MGAGGEMVEGERPFNEGWEEWEVKEMTDQGGKKGGG